MSLPQRGRERKSQSSQEGSQRPSDSVLSLTMTTERSRHLATHPGSPTDDPRARIQPYPCRPRGRAAIAQPPPTMTAKSKPTPPLAQHGLCQPRAPGSDSGQTTSRYGHGGRPRRPPAIPAIRLPAPPLPSTTSPRSDRADTGTHGHRTPTPDTGLRTPGGSDARGGHLAAVAWTGTHGHWTPDAGRGPTQ